MTSPRAPRDRDRPAWLPRHTVRGIEYQAVGQVTSLQMGADGIDGRLNAGHSYCLFAGRRSGVSSGKVGASAPPSISMTLPVT